MKRLVLAIVMALILTTLASPAPTGHAGTFPGANGPIAFVSTRSGNAEIYTMNADGSGLTRLTTDAGYDNEPSWSPDGTQIAFSSNRSGHYEIYVMNADGSGLTQVTNVSGWNADPTWSPDGTQIAFASNRDGQYDIYVINADGSGETQLTTDPGFDHYPSWSPDGTQIVFGSTRTDLTGGFIYDIFVMNADGSGLTQLTTDTGNDILPSWSPDGTQIAFTSNREGNEDIFVMNADGSSQTQITTGTARDTFPSWSPDGTQIAYVNLSTGDWEILIMNADGSGSVNLTNDTGNDTAPDWGLSPPPEADLSLTLAVDDPTPALNETITFTLSVNNAGPDDALYYQAITVLPTGLTFTGWVFAPPEGISVTNDQDITFNSYGQFAGVTSEVSFTATVDALDALTVVSQITAADQHDPDSIPNDGMGDDYDTVDITPQQPPALDTNTGLALTIDATETITDAHLEANDPDTADADLVYTVLSGPTEGALSLGPTFSQQDINDGLLTYTHDGPPFLTPGVVYENDSFTFEVSDSDYVIGPFIFDITVNVEVLPPGYYEEDEALLTFNAEWAFKSKGAASGGGAAKAKAGAVMSFWFDGDLITIIRAVGPNDGMMQVCVDGVCRLVNNTAADRAWQIPVTFGPFSNGLHYIEISRPATETQPFWFDAVEVVDLDSAVPALPTGAIVNEDSASFYYTGEWTTKSKAAAIGGVVAKSRDWYAGVAFHFTGTEFTFYTRFGPVEDDMLLCIDGWCVPLNLTHDSKYWGLDAWVRIASLSDGPHYVGLYRLPGGKFFFDGVYADGPAPAPPTAAGITLDWAAGTTTFHAPAQPDTPIEPRQPDAPAGPSADAMR